MKYPRVLVIRRVFLRLVSLSVLTVVWVGLVSVPADSSAARRASKPGVPTSAWSDALSFDRPEAVEARLNASAVVTTLVLASYRFNSGFACTAQGWTAVDITAPTGDYWHVDDFAPSNALGTIDKGSTWADGVAFNPVQGAKSMWMGKRIPPAGPIDTIHCSYLALPGYGNRWDQSFCTKDCLAVTGGVTPNLDIAFKLKFDSEPSYDGTSLEYTTDCAGNTGWTELDGGVPSWTGADSILVTGPYAVGAGPVKVRLHFVSDLVWSNQDGLYAGFGVAVDSLSVETLPVEDFEGEAVGAHESENWQSCSSPGFGNYLALFKKTTGANYEDACLDNIGCYWAAIQGSTEFYGCGTPPQPAQQVVPHKNVRNEYIANEVWSPPITLGGSGSDFRLRYTVYRDLPLNNLVFHVWHVRGIPASGCPGAWRDSGLCYYGDSKDWAIVEHAVGSKMDLATAVQLQVAIGVIDLCPVWCGALGSGACHSPAPYIDQVKVLRVDTAGPQWDVRDIELLQDTFAADGTLTGTARADAALDIAPASHAAIVPGDSAVVFYLVDPAYATGTGTNACGLLNDPVISTYAGRHKTKKQVYMYVAVWPTNQAAKTGAPLSEGPGGQSNRYPFMGTTVINGVTWSKIRMDYTYMSCTVNPGEDCSGNPPLPFVPFRFNVDLNDNLFTPGDTVCYFFSATSTAGTNYFSTETGTTPDINSAAANPMELTILPAGGYNRGGTVLYVDGADGLGDQSYFTGAFQFLGLDDIIDRYDVRSPSSGAGNRPGGRVKNVAAQLNAYEIILWDAGNLHVTLGDGSGSPEKSDDYAVLNSFLGGLANYGGVYLCGDDVAETLDYSAGASAIAFRSTYMPFTLLNSNHRLAPSLFQISPTIAAWLGRAFVDNFFVFGGCPELNDFDVMGATATSRVEMSYNTASSPDAAVLSNRNGYAGVLLSGFSFAYIRDNELNGIPDRAQHLYHALNFLGLNIMIGADDSPAISALSQNYPNPFNPQTTIEFSIALRGRVEVNVYDVGGRLVRTLADETRAAGAHAVTWDGRDDRGVNVASGVYFYRLTTPGFSQTRKMVLLK